jgi:hypothetical protein
MHAVPTSDACFSHAVTDTRLVVDAVSGAEMGLWLGSTLASLRGRSALRVLGLLARKRVGASPEDG